MSVITLRINGAAVAVPAGGSLLEACRAAGATLPLLCHHEQLAPVAACRLCLVELDGSERPVAACTTTAIEGMVVTTASETLQAHRALVIELLLAEGNHHCPVCVADGACELQDLAVALGVNQLQLVEQLPRHALDASHPRFVLDRNRCILCTRCVRACAAIEGAHVFDVAYRGSDCRLIPGLDQPWGQVDSCSSCGLCVEVCPTGALFAKPELAP
jgi:bidirectional [NiFe] hydrogenase diaphorase subunit